MSPRPSSTRIAAAAMLAVGAAGCETYRPDDDLLRLAASGEFGEARMAAAARATGDPDDRSYMLDRMKILLMGLADGAPDAVAPIADRLYDHLRTQGLNADKGVATFFIGEGGARIWKGEPYEQAMAYAAIGALDGVQGDWANVRACANNSLFLVRDFSEAIENGREELRRPSADDELAAREAIIADASARGDDAELRFRLVPSDFELGYALRALGEDQLGLTQERDETLDELLALAPRLAPLVEVIRRGEYNAVLLVDFGLGPEKVAAGSDGVIALFRARTPSTNDPIRVIVNDSQVTEMPLTTDVARLARDVRWNDLEQLRRAKSVLGTGLIVGGLVTAGVSDNEWVQLGGLLAAAVGAALKSSASVDTRHCEVLPQRSYVVPITLGPGLNRVELEIANQPETRLVLPVAPGPSGEGAAMHYVRLVGDGRVLGGPPGWAVSGEVRYANDVTGVAGPTLPYILGGRCVRTPTRALMRDYHEAGLPRKYQLADVLEMYRQEELFVIGYTDGWPGLHVLEGGDSVFTPQPASAGFARLFGREHPLYRPRSEFVRRVIAEINASARTAAPEGE